MSYNKEIESYGLIPQEEVIYSSKPFKAVNKDGYFVVGVLNNIRYNHNLPRVFCKSNIYTLDNIIKWCEVNAPNIKLISTEYYGNKVPLEWYCEIHKENFLQKWNSVVSGTNCAKCGTDIRTKKLTYTQEQALEVLTKVHGDRYDLSKIVYSKSSAKIIVVCKKHGEFSIVYSEFQSGGGCSKCANENTSIRCKANVEDMIKKFHIVHNNKYDYSKVTQDSYINSSEKITIYCKRHKKEFQQTSAHHMQGEQCPLCALEVIKSKITNKQKDVIDAFKKIHNNNYDYSKVNYVNNKVPVIIKCLKHNYEFSIKPNAHLNGHGCSLCGLQSTGWTKTKWVNSGKRSRKFDSYKVYVLKCYNDDEIFYKIGRTYQKVERRFGEKRAMPYNYEILNIIENEDGNYIFDLENKLLRLHHKNKLKYMPKIEFGGQFECFKNILDIDKILVDFNQIKCNI